MRPHAALPEASPKEQGEGRSYTDTLTVSSRTTPRNKNTSKTSRSSPVTLSYPVTLIVSDAEQDAPPRRGVNGGKGASDRLCK